jgi:septum site-determining protein MinC
MLDNPLKVEVFKLKGRLYTLTVLALEKADLQAFKHSLQSVYNQAPKMFQNTPVVLDLSALKGASFDLKGFCAAMREVNMVPVAAQGTSVIQRKAAVACGLSLISGSSKKEVDKITDIVVGQSDLQKAPVLAEKPVQDEAEQVLSDEKEVSVSQDVQAQDITRSKVITTPVRSGQQIYAKEADLIVLASVGRGAELLADGHIHVYGALRGRALAGINGNESARIFCSTLDAELLSIAGHYVMPDNQQEAMPKAKQIYLKDGHLKIETL